jgi:hypothetical protein
MNDEVEKRLPTQDVMDVLGMIYPWYWLKSTCEETLFGHMAMLKGCCYQPRKLGSTQTWIWIIFDLDILHLQSFF